MRTRKGKHGGRGYEHCRGGDPKTVPLKRKETRGEKLGYRPVDERADERDEMLESRGRKPETAGASISNGMQGSSRPNRGVVGEGKGRLGGHVVQYRKQSNFLSSTGMLRPKKSNVGERLPQDATKK